MSAPGTSPTSDCTEYRPPMSGGFRNSRLNPSRTASLANGVPLSVTATKWPPAFPVPTLASTSRLKWLYSALVSIVVPDLEDTRKRVREVSRSAVVLSTSEGSTESNTRSSG